MACGNTGVQWQLSALGEDCDVTCGYGGGSCVALPEGALTMECVWALAPSFGLTCINGGTYVGGTNPFYPGFYPLTGGCFAQSGDASSKLP